MKNLILCGLLCISLVQCLNIKKRLNFFDIDLLRHVAEGSKGNVVISPASVKAVLAMLLEGAEGETADEIINVLRVSPIRFEYREELSSFLIALKSNTTGATLQNANAVFVTNSYQVSKQYEQLIQYIYFGNIYQVNLMKPETVSSFINSWVNSKTNGLIPKIVEPGQISRQLDLMVANALYFKSKWKTGFRPELTKNDCFYSSRKCINVSMMEIQSELDYAFVDDLRAHAVSLPYEGNHYSMLLLIPQDRNGISGLIKDLPYVNNAQILNLMEPNDVHLSLPKFTVEYSDDVVSSLRKMGINKLFSKSANLTKIFDYGSPQVNNLFHRTHIQVDESGTVAAAASAAMVVPLINSGIQIKADRPFLFFIMDNNLGVTLFEGKMEVPRV